MKKFLSLVLALVMTMSLVTVSAGAKDFGDSDKIQYKEAVDVMSAVKVIDGYTDGSFNPSATLTRGAAAKIICNLILGPTTASALVADAAPYSDVPTTNVFAGYIAYCQKEGIISGYADGTFKPANSLTGYAFMKMLLGALGYDADVEGYTGPNWSVNVAKRAINIGLNDDLIGNFNGVKAVNREEACLYAFNTLQATMVEYDAKTSVSAGNTTVVIAGSKAKDMVNNNKNTDGNIDKDGLMQFAEKYFTDLKGIATSDEFMRPATQWKVKSTDVGTYTDTADATYTKAVEAGDIYKDLGLGSTIAAGKVTVYVDGVKKDAASLDIKKGDDTKVGKAINADGNGVLTEVFYDNDNDSVEITMINTYVGTISKTVKATDKKDAYVVVAAETPAPKTGYDNKFETDEKFEDDAYVLYTYSLKSGDEGIQSVALATKVSGTVTRAENSKDNNKQDAKALTMDGTVYKDSLKVAGDKLGDISVDEAYDIYLDAYGYMIYVERINEIGDYALLVDAQGSSAFEDNRALLVFSDGTSKLVDTKKNYEKAENLDMVDAAGKDVKGTVTAPVIVTYKVDSANVYTLRAVASKQSNGTWNTTESVIGAANNNDFWLKSDKAGIKVNGSAVTANSVTQFVVRETSNDAILAGDDWDVYTGVKNAPNIEAKGGTDEKVTAYYYCKDGKMTTIMFVVPEAKADVDGSVNKQIFFSKDVSKLIHDKTGDYYEYPAIVNGEIKTVKVDWNTKAGAKKAYDLGGLFFKSYTVDKDGFITKLTSFSDNYTTAAPNNGEKGVINQVKGIKKTSEAYTIIVGSYTLTVDENAKIFSINEDDEITEVGYKGIAADENAVVSAYVEDYMVKTLVIYEKKTVSTPSGSDIKSTSELLTANGANIYKTGYANFTYTVERPEYIADTVALGYSFNVYVNGEKYGSKSGTIAASSKTDADSWNNNGVFSFAPIDASDVIEVKDFAFTATGANGLDHQDYIVKCVDEKGNELKASLFSVAPAATLNADTGAILTFTIDGSAFKSGDFDWEIKNVKGAGATLSDEGVAFNAGAQSTTATVKPVAGLEDYVKVVITSRMITKDPTVTMALDTAAATKIERTLADYGVSGATDKGLTLKVTLTGAPTNKAPGFVYDLSNVKVEADFDGTPNDAAAAFTEAYGYKVTIKGLGTVILSQKDKEVALTGTKVVDKDITLSKADVTVEVIEKLTITGVSFSGRTATVTFSEDVDVTSGETVGNYTWANGGKTNTCSVYSAKVSGRNVVLTFAGDELVAGNTITVGAGVKSAEIAGNVNTTITAQALA